MLPRSTTSKRSSVVTSCVIKLRTYSAYVLLRVVYTPSTPSRGLACVSAAGDASPCANADTASVPTIDHDMHTSRSTAMLLLRAVTMSASLAHLELNFRIYSRQ